MTLSLFICSASCCFLLLFSIHLFLAKRGNRLLNYLLALLMLSRFGQLLIPLLIHSDQQVIFPGFYQLFTPLWYITPACFYLYTVSFIYERHKLSSFQWLHFIPVIFAIIHILPWPSNQSLNWSSIATQLEANKQLFITENTGLFPPVLYNLFRPVLIIAYLMSTWHVVFKSKIMEHHEDQSRITWLLLFLKIGTFFQLSGFLSLLFWTAEQSYIAPLFLAMNSLVILMIMVFVLHHPKLFYGYLFVAVRLDTEQHTLKIHPPNVANQEKKISLLPDQLSRYANAMREIMELKKPYLLESFQIVDLAGSLNIPVHHCSFVLNKLIGKNFRDWINEYRIQTFMEQYPLKAEKMTIESIARECGFKSTATFYNAFKKETGLMPTAYFSQKKVS